MASSSSLHHYYQLYEETLTSYVPHMFAFTDKYREVLPISAVIIYLIMVFCLPPLLKSKDGQRKPVGALLKYSMITWNLFLSVFSGVLCVLSALPFFINFVSKRGFIDTICDTKHDLFLPSSMLFWGLLFVFSKYIELFDTLFLILKNPERPVPFLHWYHHTTVLLFSWYATTSRYTLGYYFGAINASVHTLMYYYYFQMERGIRPTWAKPLTIFQISQMIMGITLNALFAREWLSGRDCECHHPREMLIACVIMYASYLFLFCRFFVQRYWGAKKPVPTKEKKQ